MTKQIVLVEDEEAIRQNYANALRRQNYEVLDFADSHTAMGAFDKQLPDLAILDIGLGDDTEAGFDLCRELRSRSTGLPIIFLTARDSDLDTVSGLRLGADDYLTKNITLEQLSARVAALFRRVEALSTPQNDDDKIEYGDLQIDSHCMFVKWKNTVVELTLTEFWVVYSLARIPGHVKNRDQLMQDAKIFVDDGTITSHIKRIRKKFKLIDSEFDCIETVYGMGYRWNR